MPVSDMPFVRAQLLEVLSRLSDKEEDTANLTLSLRKALLDFASEPPDNVNCADRIEVERVDNDTALKIINRAVLLGDIAHVIEDAPMPESLKIAYPGLTADH
jgi:hypothetical protein